MRTEGRQLETQRHGTGKAVSPGEARGDDTPLWLAEDASWQPSIGHLLQAQFQAWRDEADQLGAQRV